MTAFDEFMKLFEEIIGRKITDGEKAIYLMVFEKGREVGRKEK